MVWIVILLLLVIVIAIGLVATSVWSFIVAVLNKDKAKQYVIAGVASLLGSACFWWFATSFVYVSTDEVVLYEWRGWGTRVPPSRNIAYRGELGWQARPLSTGWHWGLFPGLYKIERHAPQVVPSENRAYAGVVILLDGAQGQSHLVASPGPPVADIYDGEQFCRHPSARRGIQPFTVGVGPHRVNPRLFKIAAVPLHERTFYMGVDEESPEWMGGEVTAETSDAVPIIVDVSLTLQVQQKDAPLFFASVDQSDPLTHDPDDPYSGVLSTIRSVVRETVRIRCRDHKAGAIQQERGQLSDDIAADLVPQFAAIGLTLRRLNLREIRGRDGFDAYDRISELEAESTIQKREADLARDAHGHREQLLDDFAALVDRIESGGAKADIQESLVSLWLQAEQAEWEARRIERLMSLVGPDNATRLLWAERLAEHGLQVVPQVVGGGAEVTVVPGDPLRASQPPLVPDGK